MKVSILLIFVFLINALSIAAQTSDRERGIEAFNQKKYAEAIGFFDKSIKSEGADITSLFYLGQSFEKLEKKNESVKNYTLAYQKGILIIEKTFFESVSGGDPTVNHIEYVKNKIRDKIDLALKSGERLQAIESGSAQNLYLQNALLTFKYFLNEKKAISQTFIEDYENKKLKVIKKPAPSYSKRGIKNLTSGEVHLYVMFLANGKIGLVVPKTFLPDDLTQAAIDAARKIEFEPQLSNGEPVTVD